MHCTIQAFWLPKAGHSLSDYEDAFWPKKSFDGNSTSVRLAVGDGATETSFAAVWAKLLVRAYSVGDLLTGTLPEKLPQLQDRWRRIVGRKQLPWYAEEKLRFGAFSTLL